MPPTTRRSLPRSRTLGGDRDGDGDAAYEVEVRLAEGSQIEVQLDESFAVISSKADDDGLSDTEDDDDWPFAHWGPVTAGPDPNAA